MVELPAHNRAVRGSNPLGPTISHKEANMINIKNKEQISGIKRACVLAARCLTELEPFIIEGQNTAELDRIAHENIQRHHATPAPLNYKGFPKSICTSLNEVVCHGIPSEKDILKNGDILNIDITVILNGYFGDTSRTYIIGEVSDDVKHFVDRAEKAMYKGIEILRPGVNLNQLGKTIETYVSKFKYSVVRDFGGHGTGLAFHEEPHVHHFYDPVNPKVILKEGMIFTVEPMINKSPDWEVVVSKADKWTVRTRNKSLSAQFEHTVLITKSGAEILTINN